MQILIKRKVDGPSVPELGTPTSVTFDSITVPLNRASTGPSALAQYELQRSLDGSTWATIATGPSIFGNPPVQFVDGGRIALTTYYYRARALDVAGRASGYSATVSATTAASVLPGALPMFPRVASIWVGGPMDYDKPAYQQGMAQFDLVFINGYETWENNTPPRQMTYTQACANAKALNPNLKIHKYVNSYDAISYLYPNLYPYLESVVTQQNWFLRQSYPSGEIIRDTQVYFAKLANGFVTMPASTLLNGQTYIEWYMSKYVKEMHIDGVHGLPANPYLDGIFFDNVLMVPFKDGDYNSDGVIDDVDLTPIHTGFRQGYAAGATRFRAAMPSLKLTGNLNFAYIVTYNVWNLANPDPTYNQVFDGGLYEHFCGTQVSASEWGTSEIMLRAARVHGDMCIDPTLQVLHVNRLHSLSATNYQDFRHGICAALCATDGYITYVDTQRDGYGSRTGFDGAARWFDEYDRGGVERYYLGAAEDQRLTATWSQGVYRRRFENGWVLWNPRGNGVRTVQLGQSMKKIQGRSGYSDTAVNNGATVTSVTLQDRDGLVLLNV
jgi:hypothetical protein